jgi:TonB-linked SusC/RagA family outer membrane protein
MPFYALIFLALCLLISSKGYTQHITLSEKNASIDKVFRSIEKQSDYLFWYEYPLLKDAKKINISVKNISIREALDLCMKDQPLMYTIVGNTIVITKKKENEILADQPALLLTEESLTDSMSTSLDEVVIIGYGSLSKRNITGSLSSINFRVIKNQPVASIDQAMAGQVAGVRVSQLTGTPGGGATVRVRGTGSITAGNEPLYVIDGFPVEGGYNRDLNPLATINPYDIESVQILKDASSASIYGSRGSNGVVLITTKKGKPGKPVVQFDSYYGIQEIEQKTDMLNASEYASYNIEARNNAWTDMGGSVEDPDSMRPERLRIPPMFADPSSLGKGTDWQNEIFRSAPVQNHHVSLSAGNESTQYMLSAAYFDQKGIVLHTGFQRYSIRFNMDSRLSRKVRMGFTISPTYSKNTVLPVEDQVFGGGILGSALAMPPTVPVYNPDGSFTTLLSSSVYNVGTIDNPVAMANQLKGGTSAFRILSGLFAEWEIVSGLKLKTSVGVDYYDDRYNSFWPSTLGRNGSIPPVISEGNASTTRNYVWLNENTVSYSKTFSRKHFINAVAGITAQDSKSERAYLRAINFPNDRVTTINAGQIISGGTEASEWALFSYLARVNYSYDSKYLLTATVRRDGSSRFGAENRWATFPSASVGWNISKENFMLPVHFVSDMKLRMSYGFAGNNSIGNYNFTGGLNTGRYVFGAGTGSVVSSLQPLNLSNPMLGWEVMKQTDVGLDLAIVNNRIIVVIDYFNKITSDLLLDVPVPGSTGFSTALQNIGKLSNKGWEFTVSSINTVHQLKWKTDVNISFYKNKVLALGPERDPIITTSRGFSPQTHITQIGQSIGSFYGYEVIGVYLDQADIDKSPTLKDPPGSRPGDLKFRDNNGDGVISPLDMKIIGNNTPDISYGITNHFSYRHFVLSILIDGVQGVEVLNGSRRNIELTTYSYSRRDVLGRWQSPENPGNGKTPRANNVPTGGNVTLVSSLLIEDASFIRIRNIHLSYAIPQKIFRSVAVKNASVFCSVQNAWIISKYKGFNPEQSLNGANSLTPGVDFNGYPVARVFTVGLSVSFQ